MTVLFARFLTNKNNQSVFIFFVLILLTTNVTSTTEEHDTRYGKPATNSLEDEEYTGF
jgi:hypothetical protein